MSYMYEHKYTEIDEIRSPNASIIVPFLFLEFIEINNRVSKHSNFCLL